MLKKKKTNSVSTVMTSEPRPVSQRQRPRIPSFQLADMMKLPRWPPCYLYCHIWSISLFCKFVNSSTMGLSAKTPDFLILPVGAGIYIRLSLRVDKSQYTDIIISLYFHFYLYRLARYPLSTLYFVIRFSSGAGLLLRTIRRTSCYSSLHQLTTTHSLLQLWSTSCNSSLSVLWPWPLTTLRGRVSANLVAESAARPTSSRMMAVTTSFSSGLVALPRLATWYVS